MGGALESSSGGSETGAVAPEPEDPTVEGPKVGDAITLPIEVIGPDGYTQEVRFTLEDKADTLYLRAHRLAYRDASTNPERGAKGSVRLNGGDWLDLSNDTEGLECYAHEAAYGCLNGAYHTVRFRVPIEGARAGENTLEFRFNGHDEKTSGYRILEMNLLEGGKKVLPQSTFRDDDPTAWEPPLDNSSDIQKGQKLWEEATLADFPGGPKIKVELQRLPRGGWTRPSVLRLFQPLDHRAQQVSRAYRERGRADRLVRTQPKK